MSHSRKHGTAAQRLPLATPENTIYQIPMNVVYGPGIPGPAKVPATLDISLEEIRQEMVGVIM